jgi:hypothetical protein
MGQLRLGCAKGGGRLSKINFANEWSLFFIFCIKEYFQIILTM